MKYDIQTKKKFFFLELIFNYASFETSSEAEFQKSLNSGHPNAHTTTISVLWKFPVCKNINVWAHFL